ncbi:hypothetical protein [Kocuria rosea]|uniref:hypothetical protein n=1 Tax=Kocuria rosea TaxID=1275 RepID=UPI000D64896A|nr:hypothetical protein [Kocuria rosea]PWF82011.1 hypothetical protein DEJ37_15905 [Kocuria rosea]STX02585.1 Uncharacterised protein [Kocuria rosea]
MPTQMNLRPLFAPASGIPSLVPERVAAAYSVAGLDAPTVPGHAIGAALRAIPDAPALARQLVGEAHDYSDEDPAVWLDSARARLADAQALDLLRETWARTGGEALAARGPRLTDQAASDLRGAFDKAVRGLTQAVAKLDPARPLDPETAVARDAGAALTTARRELARLGAFAGIHPAVLNTGYGSLNKLAPILAIEGAAVERIAHSVGEHRTVLNEDQLGTTRAVRRLAEDGKQDLDLAVLGVARGDYQGVSLRLNSTRQRQETLEQVSTALVLADMPISL